MDSDESLSKSAQADAEPYVLSSDTESSEELSDDLFSTAKKRKRRVRRAKKPPPKRGKAAAPDDEDDESMSEGVLGVGKGSSGRRSAGSRSAGSAGPVVPMSATPTAPTTSVKGKERASLAPSTKSTPVVVIDDSGGESDVSDSVMTRTAPKYEQIDMGLYFSSLAAAERGEAREQEAEQDSAMSAEDVEEVMQQRESEIGIVRTKVVGIQYYQGLALPQELVQLIREPQNPYDAFALRVNNQNGQQVGHIPKAVVKVLSPLIDRGKLRLEGIVSGHKTQFDLPINLHAFCLPENVAEVSNSLRVGRIALQAFRALQNPNAASSAAAQRTLAEEAWAKLLRSGQKIEPESAQELLADLGLPAKDLAKIKMAPQPEHLQTQLLPYQRQGLYWMLEAEHPRVPRAENQTTQFWTFKRDNTTGRQFFHNFATGFGSHEVPQFMRGGILADDMGLGKTIQIISLLLTDPQPVTIVPCDLQASDDFCKATLIVCPLSLLDNWVSQMAKHVVPERDLRVFVYHGDNRKGKTKGELKKFDVVLTTYTTLAQPRCDLMAIKWRRVVLDEGHNVRTHGTQQSQACAAVQAERRWIVSGTPIQNGVDDVYGLIRFLGLQPFNTIEFWRRTFSRPVKKGEEAGLLRLKMLMQFLCLRRTKRMRFDGKPLVALPPCQMYLHKVAFYPEEEKASYALRQIYRAMERESLEMFRKMEEQGDDEVFRNYANILEILMRLRQICDHKDLIGDRELKFLNQVVKGDASMINWSDPSAQKLLQILRDNEGEDCSICLDTLKEPALTPCAHFFCSACIKDVINRSVSTNKAPCPLCRREIKGHELAIPPPDVLAGKTADDADESEEEAGDAKDFPSSSKIDALLSFLTSSHRKDPTTKSVVFSQWATMLNKIEPALRKSGIDYVRFDGSMSVKRRDAAVRRFQSDPGCRVFLATLKSGGLGLNLVEANFVYLMDPWWNPAIEDQAVDRVHRLGQTRECTCVRFVIERTVEDRVMELQKRKRKLVKEALGDGRAASTRDRDRIREQRLAELRTLFNTGEQTQPDAAPNSDS
ncbi:SNF2 family N-terminal domain-containing protein [Hyaloraphidium curvatum]|nr:SNF2 family N-terminal domain-containing protein [Hyaloraphidium curvatum]